MIMCGLGDDGCFSGSGFYNNTTTFDPEEINVSLSCVSESIQGPVMLPYSSILLDTVRGVQSIFLSFLFLVGTCLNLLVIILVAKCKKLHTISFGLALQIVAHDLLLSLVVGLLGLISVIANQWIFGQYICAIVGSVLTASSIVRGAIMFIFIVDRFITVFCPFAYPKFQSKIIAIVSIVSWLYAWLVSVIGIFLDCYKFMSTASWICSFSSACSKNCSIISGLLVGVFSVPASLIPLFLYTLLFIKAKIARKAMTEPTTGIGNVDTTHKPKHDWKATITFFLLFITVFPLTVPSLTIFFTINLLYKREKECQLYSMLLPSLPPI